jgi:hypothetical protein
LEKLNENEKDTEKTSIIQKEKLILLGNLSACEFYNNNYKEVIDLTTKILLIDKNNIKILLRRGESYLKLKKKFKALVGK